jgi:hypothetical protein
MGRGAAEKDLSKIQPLCKHLQQLRQEGLTEIHHLQTFFSRRIQPLPMWACPGSSYLNRPSLEELSAVEVEAQIRKVLDSAFILSHSAGHDPLQRGITSIRVST